MSIHQRTGKPNDVSPAYEPRDRWWLEQLSPEAKEAYLPKERPRHKQVAECKRILRKMERSGELPNVEHVMAELPPPEPTPVPTRPARQAPPPQPVVIRPKVMEVYHAIDALAKDECPMDVATQFDMALEVVKRLGVKYCEAVCSIRAARRRGADPGPLLERFRSSLERDAENGWINVVIPEVAA